MSYSSRHRLLIAGLILGLSIPASIASTATAKEVNSPSTDVYVLDESAAGVEHFSDSTFYPLPENSENALVVTEEVAEDLGIDSVGSLKAEEADLLNGEVSLRAADAGWTAFAAGGNGNWGSWSRARLHYTGQSGGYKYYQWAAHPLIDASICGQAYGYYRGYNGSQFGIWSKTYNVGCTGGGSVPWDNTIAYPMFRGANMFAWPAGGNFR